MVRRYDILKGDRTTADGTVMGLDSRDTIGHAQQAYERDEVWCPTCQSMGVIVCGGPRFPATGPDGRESALSDDLCVCKCEPSPRLLPSQSTSYVDV